MFNTKLNDDAMLKLCIEQGYVPSNCQLNGTILFLLIREGCNPCLGCNVECEYRKKVTLKDPKELQIANLDKQRDIKVTRIRKRSKNNSIIMNIDCDYKTVHISVMDLMNETICTKRFYDFTEATCYIPVICYKYKVEQIIIDIAGCGVSIYDSIKNKVDVDIVPLKYVPMKVD